MKELGIGDQPVLNIENGANLDEFKAARFDLVVFFYYKGELELSNNLAGLQAITKTSEKGREFSGEQVEPMRQNALTGIDNLLWVIDGFDSIDKEKLVDLIELIGLSKEALDQKDWPTFNRFMPILNANINGIKLMLDVIKKQ